jgi:sortase B
MTQTTKFRLKILAAVAGGVVLALAAVLLLRPLLAAPPKGSAGLSAGPQSQPEPEQSAPTAELEDNPIDFEELWETAPNAVGWIKVPGTVIDYPVMRSTPKMAEDYYLHRDVDGEYLYAGSIYMQKRNSADFSDAATLLYGHNMKNGSKFAALHKFEKKDFFQKHDTLYIYTPGHIYTYRIYSVFVYDDRLITAAFDFTDPEDVAAYHKLTLDPRSYSMQVRKGVTLVPDDRIVTLSTCTNHEKERLLLHAVMIEDTPTR